VLRTGSGTRCVVAAKNAVDIWLGSLVVAGATARALAGSDEVTLVASGCPNEGEEDIACAEWIAALLRGGHTSRETVVATVTGSRAAVRHRSGDADFPAADIDCAVAIDAFAFAMKVERLAGRLVARPFAPGGVGDGA
jgi:2-phosphosulfolactate phosphatase